MIDETSNIFQQCVDDWFTIAGKYQTKGQMIGHLENWFGRTRCCGLRQELRELKALNAKLLAACEISPLEE